MNNSFAAVHPEHNLVRARCQIALAKDVKNHREQMEQIIVESMNPAVLSDNSQISH